MLSLVLVTRCISPAFVRAQAREDAQASALARGADDADDSDQGSDEGGEGGQTKKARRAGGAAATVPPTGGITRRAVPGGLASLAGGGGRKYVEFTSEVPGLAALAQVDADRRAEQRATAAAAATGIPKVRFDTHAVLDRL